MAVNMELWGISETGFYRPTIDDILNAKITLAKEIFGEDFDTDELAPQGMFFRVNAAAESKLCEIAEGIYYSIFPHTATGVSLDRICEVANLHRDGAGYAEHQIKVYGTQGYIIEAGTEFKNTDGVEFYSVMNATITELDGDKYYANVEVQCKESGEKGNVNDINSTVEVNPNITNIVWTSIKTYGIDAENDPELREKFATVIQGMGTNTTNSIIANVLREKGVNDVIIIDNNTETDVIISDNLTIKAGTYAVIVQSDSTTNQDIIAKAIFEKQPLGISQSGTEEVIVLDNSNTEHTVKFTYVATKNIDITVSCVTDSTFASSGIEDIKNNITSYINSLGIGQEVVYSQLYKYIYAVTGVNEVTAMTVNNGTSNIAINQIEIAKAGTIKVTVEG